MTLRTRNRGRTGLKDTALARFGFFAHLRTHVLLAKGVGAPSFTRATVATVKDFEGCIRNVLSGEVRFEGQRRVYNRITGNSNPATGVGAWVAGAAVSTITPNFTTAPDGTTTATKITTDATLNAGIYLNGLMPTAGTQAVFSIWLKGSVGGESVQIGDASARVTVTLTTKWARYSNPAHASVSAHNVIYSNNIAQTFYAWGAQLEFADGQSNQNPSEYVSVGAAKLNMLLQTEAYTSAAWTSSLSSIAQNGTLGGVVAWDIVDSSAVAYANTQQTVTVPNDGTTYTFGLRIKKTSGATIAFGVNLVLSGGGAVTKSIRFNSDTGAVAYGATNFDTVIDAGTYWDVRATITNNTSGNTALVVTIFPATGTIGVGDSVAAQATATIAAPWLSTSVQPYFPVGNVYPYHGAMVDGVKYFATENPNVVIDNVVYDTSTQPYTSTKWLRLPGASGAYVTSPNLQITSDWQCIFDIEAVDYTPSSNQVIAAQYVTGNLGFILYITTAGNLACSWSLDGTTSYANQGLGAIPIADGVRGKFKITCPRSASDRIKSWISYDDGATWTYISQSNLLDTRMFASTTPMEIGTRGAGTTEPFQGKIYSVEFYSGIGGGATLVRRFAASDATVGGNAVFTSSTTGEVWTVNGTAAIRITPPGRLPRQLDGYAAAYKVQENSVANTFSTLGTYQPRGDMAFWAEVALDNWVPSASNGIGRQWNEGSGRVWNLLIATDGRITVHASTDGNLPGAISSTNATGFAAGSKHFVGFTRVAATGLVSIYTSEDGVTWDLAGTGNSTAGNLWTNNSDFIRIGVSGAGGDFCMGGKIFRAKMFAQANFTSTPVLDFNPREGWTENAVTGSDDFTTNWTLTNLTKTTGAIAAPDGTMTGVRLEATTTAACNSVCTISGIGSGAEHTYTVYAHESGDATANFFNLYNASLGASIVSGSLDYSTGVFSYGTGSTGVVVTKGGNGWWRIDMTGVCPVGANINVYAAFTGGSRPAGTKAYVWHPSLRRVAPGGQRTTSGYLPTTTAALRGWISSTGEQWTMNGAASVLQRQAEGYLSEGATTNLVLQSSNFGTTWTLNNTPTRVAAAAYCGDIALDLIGDDDATSVENYLQTITLTGDGVKVMSALIKQGSSTSSVFHLRDVSVPADRIFGVVTWSNGLPVCTMVTGTQERQPEAMGNGVYRIFFASTSVTAINVHSVRIYPATSAGMTVADTGTIYVGGVQVENSVMASNLQPTTTGTAGRNADFLYYQDSGNLSASQGSSYIEAGPLVGSGSTQVLLGHGDLSGRMVYNAGTPAVMTTYDGVNSVSSTSTRAPSQMAKVATVWGASSLKISTEAGVGTTSFDGSMGIAGNISVGSAPAGNQMEGLTKNVRIAQVIESSTDMIAVSK